MNKNKQPDTLNKWILDTNVVCKEPKKISDGAYSAGYDAKKMSWQFYYTEITGYAISCLSFLYIESGNPSYLEQAKKSSEYLMRVQDKRLENFTYGAYPKGVELEDSSIIEEYYSFDTAMCIQGLLDLYRLENNKSLLDSAIMAGNWLLTMQKDNGSFFAFFDGKSKQIRHEGHHFYDDNGALHAKNAIALLKLYKATNNKKYKLAAVKLCKWVLSLQSENGAFWVNETKAYVYAHVHCYVLEGLVYANQNLNDVEIEEAIKRGVEWLKKKTIKLGIISTHMQDKKYIFSEQITSNQILNSFRKKFPRQEIATDATFQMIRLMVLRGEKDVKYDLLIKGLLNRGSFENPLPARIETSLGWPRNSKMCSTWGVLFAIQALCFVNKNNQKKESNSLEYLF